MVFMKCYPSVNSRALFKVLLQKVGFLKHSLSTILSYFIPFPLAKGSVLNVTFFLIIMIYTYVYLAFTNSVYCKKSVAHLIKSNPYSHCNHTHSRRVNSADIIHACIHYMRQKRKTRKNQTTPV